MFKETNLLEIVISVASSIKEHGTSKLVRIPCLVASIFILGIQVQAFPTWQVEVLLQDDHWTPVKDFKQACLEDRAVHIPVGRYNSISLSRDSVFNERTQILAVSPQYLGGIFSSGQYEGRKSWKITVECAIIPKQLDQPTTLSQEEKERRARFFYFPENRLPLSRDRVCAPLQLASENLDVQVIQTREKAHGPQYAEHMARAEFTAPGAQCHDELKAYTADLDKTGDKWSSLRYNYSQCINNAINSKYPHIFRNQKRDDRDLDRVAKETGRVSRMYVECETDPVQFMQKYGQTTEYKNWQDELERHLAASRSTATGSQTTAGMDR